MSDAANSAPSPVPDLTIGELFAAGDVVGEWVFSLSTVVDDLLGIKRRMQAVPEAEDDMRILLLFQRMLAVRLYEARRLVYVADERTEIREFLGENPPVWFKTLRDMNPSPPVGSVRSGRPSRSSFREARPGPLGAGFSFACVPSGGLGASSIGRLWPDHRLT